jgi:hypothetical protein
MRGFLVPNIGGFDGRDILGAAVENGCPLRIMMAHPEVAELRAACEGRGQGDITKEIKSSLGLLKRLDVPRDCVKYYRMGPTAFGIATSDSMLLNPYPSARESQRCFSIIVHKTQQATDIYQQYRKHHFDELWESYAEVVPDTDWTPAEAPIVDAATTARR